MQAAPSERFHALDSLRAVAMFLGIVLHAGLSFSTVPIPWVVHDAGRQAAFDILLGSIHGFRMPLFFFIAGFFAHLVWRRAGTRGFLRQRGSRIGLPFLAGMVTIMPVGGAIWLWANDGRMLPGVVLPTMHLWFLEMLLILYAIAMLAVWMAARFPVPALAARVDAFYDAFIRSPWKVLPMVPPTMLCFWNGPFFGEVEMMGLSALFAPRTIAYFGMFFATGWWLHRRVHLLDALRGWLKTYFLLAFLAFMTLGACVGMPIRPGSPDFLWLKLAALAAAALYAWTMTFAVTGLFLRLASAHRPWMRYLADASYWMYLWHIPLVMWLQVLVAQSPLNAWLKFAFVLAATTAILLPSYHWLVRYSWVGRLLNGPRLRPALSR
jgi:peptidoglycan/LPS O-acetylase OafA/YrhL